MGNSRKLALLFLISFIGLEFKLAHNSSAAFQFDFSEDAIKERIIKKSIDVGVDPHVSLSLVKQESNFDREAKSYVGAIGLFQLMPETANDLGVNPYYINQNIEGGLKYFKSLKEEFGSTELALAAYNAGPGAVKRYKGIPPYRETKNYVKNIMNNYKNYKKNPDVALIKHYLNPIKQGKIEDASTEKIEEKQDKDKEKFSISSISISSIFSKIVSFFV